MTPLKTSCHLGFALAVALGALSAARAADELLIGASRLGGPDA